MSEIVTILAEFGGEQREVFRVKQGKDESLYVISSGSKFPDSYISLHGSGDFHVTRSKDGMKLKISLPEGQPLKTFKGCSSQNVQIIYKSLFIQLRKRNISNVKSDVFVVDLARFKTPLVGIAMFLFDPSSIIQFQNRLSEYTNPLTKIIRTITPNIGLIAHEPQVT